MNRQIRADIVRLVDTEGQHGIMTLDEALELAQKRELDLVEISADAKPPVCKIIDFGKFRYEQQKKEREAKKKQHTIVLKEIRFGPQTDEHDFQFKLKHAQEFLTEGNKVKAYVQFKGRAIMYSNQGAELLKRFVSELKEISKVDQAPTLEGRRMTTILSPAKKK
ncbi:MAG TPA: translation initiation factor IF-3 [Rhodothermales bacterium]|nr:translation initiation factor IF-3 [Rhodothermales bacterium]HRR07306.1 translation initiation factor IF-3 [Rhodothermales bacterium]